QRGGVFGRGGELGGSEAAEEAHGATISVSRRRRRRRGRRAHAIGQHRFLRRRRQQLGGAHQVEIAGARRQAVGGVGGGLRQIAARLGGAIEGALQPRQAIEVGA